MPRKHMDVVHTLQTDSHIASLFEDTWSDVVLRCFYTSYTAIHLVA